ncbi:MAG: hypothetical protein U9P49_02150 [Thermodesulfobacteriota bacterium]|nr:hypothetical protein [Thermodesulfobacteriota bacterium]
MADSNDSNNRKADLDKEGITLPGYEKEKEDPDEEGVSASDEKSKGDAEKDTPDTVEEGSGKKSPIKIIGFAGIGIIVLLGAVFFLFLNKKDEVSTPQRVSPYQKVQVIEEGEVLLDPFVILYKQKDAHTGVLLAQVSLQGDPRYVSNIQSKMFEIRSLVLDRLTTNVQIYSKKEILDILEADLSDLGVRNVDFVQYQLR